jgi:hypothetical protein
MSSRPKVTIGVATFNVDFYLRGAFDDVLAQDFAALDADPDAMPAYPTFGNAIFGVIRLDALRRTRLRGTLAAVERPAVERAVP